MRRFVSSSRQPIPWFDVLKLILGIIVWLVMLALTFYSLFTLPVLLLVGAYVVYVVAAMQTKASQIKEKGYADSPETPETKE